jgi:hypothetical protein
MFRLLASEYAQNILCFFNFKTSEMQMVARLVEDASEFPYKVLPASLKGELPTF